VYVACHALSIVLVNTKKSTEFILLVAVSCHVE